MVQLAHYLCVCVCVCVCVCIANTEGSEWPTIFNYVMEIHRNAEKSLKLQKLVTKEQNLKN